MRKDKQKVKIDYSFISNLFIGIMIFISISNLFAHTTNTFDKKIKVGPIEAITLGNTSQDTVYHCQFAQDTFTVTNTGDTDLDNIIFGSTNFNGIIDNTYFIPRECIYFTPSYINELPSDSTITVIVNIYVRCGLFAQDYKGKARVMDDDGYPHETIELWITVLPKYDLDISNNEWNLVSNILYLAEIPGNSDSGLFLLITPNTDMINVDPDSFGNADITNLTYTMTNLTGPGPDIITTNISITPTPMILASGYADTLLYEVDIPEGQIPGLYEGMAYVTSPGEDDTGDFFYVNLVVGPVESIVLTGTLDQTVDHGVTAIDTFMVTNNGNVDLDNIVFWVTDLYGGAGHMIVLENITFEPTSINELVATDSVEVKVHVNVPLGTYAITYTGMLRVIDDDGFPSDVIGVSVTVEPSYDLDICDNALSLFFNTMELSGIPGTSPTGNFLAINPNSEAMNADPDLFGNADLFDVDAVSTVLQHVDNPLYSIPTDSVVIAISQTLLSGSDEAVPVVVNIPDGQEEGAYVGTIIVWDMVVGVFDDFEILVQVASEEDIDIIETITSGSGDHASWVDLTTFTVENTGNTNLYNLLFNTSGLVSVDYFIPPDDIYLYVTDFWAPANEAVLDVLLIGESADVQPEVDVHRGQHAGIYSGFISVIDDDGYPTDAIVVSLEVFPSYDIDISDIEEDVVGNIMSLYACLGDTTEEKSFLTINPSNDVMNVDPDCFGNADYSVTYLSRDLIFDFDTISSVNVTITPSTSYLVSGGSEVVALYITIPSDTTLDDGKYFGYITAHADTEGIVVCSDSFRLELNVSSEGVTEWINAVLDSVFFISQNKPNPLNDKTLVKYNLPEDCRVFIKIYDLLGYEIKTLLRVKQKAGMHTVVWDGRDDLGKKVPAGVYFLKVTAGKYTETNKLLKMK